MAGEPARKVPPPRRTPDLALCKVASNVPAFTSPKITIVPRLPQPQPARPAREVMSAEEVADFLDLNVDSVREAAGRGDVPHRRVGRRMIFSRSALVEWLRGSSVQPRGRSR